MAYNMSCATAQICLCGENVDALLDDPDANEESNLKVLQQAMEELEYQIVILRLNACQFALPQHRVRVVILGTWIASPLLGAMDGFASRLTDVIKEFCFSGPPDVRDALLKHNSWEVKEMLKQPKERDDSLANASHENWPDLHQRFLRAQGIRWSTLEPTPANVKSPFFERLSLREREIVNYSCLAKNPKNLIVNISQSINVLHFGRECEDKMICSVQMPGGKYWLEDGHRILLGREGLALQGFPYKKVSAKVLAQFGESFLQDLAGNAYPGTMMLSCVIAAITSAAWQTPRMQQLESAKSAVSLMKRSLARNPSMQSGASGSAG